MVPRLYLASTSPWRRELLARLGLPFAAEAPGVDEAPREGEAPAGRALRLADEKALAVARRHPGAWVIGSDQVAECGGQLLGKPGDAPTCRRQLAACSGRAVEFHTAVVLRREESVCAQHVDLTRVTFRVLGDLEIAAYVERERPFDCAGGFRCEGLGIALFERIDSRDPTALIGLPLIALASALRRSGLDPLAVPQA